MQEPNKRVSFTSQSKLASQNLLISGKTSPPESIAEQRDVLRSGSIFLRQESSAQLCLHSQHGEKIRAYFGCLKLFGQVATGVVEAVTLKRRNVSEGAVLTTPIQQVSNRQGCTVADS